MYDIVSSSPPRDGLRVRDCVPVLYGSQDAHLDEFFSLVSAAEQRRVPPHVGEHRFEQSLRVSLTNLSLVRPAPLVAFLPLVLDKLTLLMCKPPVIAGQTSECAPPDGGGFIDIHHKVVMFL